MKSSTYYKTRTIIRTLFWFGVLVAFYLIATRIWWNEGLCIGTILECGL